MIRVKTFLIAKTAAVSDINPMTHNPNPKVTSIQTARNADLSWLMFRASESIGDEIRNMAKCFGISDHRHWLVLSFIDEEAPQNQLNLAKAIGLDKTTLMAIIDKLERDGLVIRTLSKTDRRVRIPQLTEKGLIACGNIRTRRDKIVSKRLASISLIDQEKLRVLLWQILDNPANSQ